MDYLIAHKDLLIGWAAGVLSGWLVSALPIMIINRCIIWVDALFAKGDAADDRLLIAFLRWVNEKLGPKVPGDLSWPLRMNTAVMRLVSLIPILPVRMFLTLHADRIKELCCKLYELGIAAAQREAAQHEHDNDAPPAAPPAV